MYIRQLPRTANEGFWNYIRHKGWQEPLCAYWIYERRVKGERYRLWLQPMGKRRVAALQAIRWEASEQTGSLVQALLELQLARAEGSEGYQAALEREPDPCAFCVHRDTPPEERPIL